MDKKIALVTGGNRGIGSAIVHGLEKKVFMF
jgi:NAD(P)-dependent dehydrogenase (short-subunit alcohol dehydrogenase family)